MLFLNLLPEKFSQEIKLRNLFQTIFRSGIVFILVLVSVSASFFMADRILQSFFKVVDNTNFLIQTQIEEPVDVREVNLKLSRVEDIQEKSFPWLEVLGEVSGTLPEGVFLESLEVNKEEKVISMSGVSLTRQYLVEFRNNLEESDIFLEPDLPLENILKREDINFTIKANIELSD